jgi:hypothetical protein
MTLFLYETVQISNYRIIVRISISLDIEFLVTELALISDVDWYLFFIKANFSNGPKWQESDTVLPFKSGYQLWFLNGKISLEHFISKNFYKKFHWHHTLFLKHEIRFGNQMVV